MMGEVTKFNPICIDDSPLAWQYAPLLWQFDSPRKELQLLGMIGVDDSGIGYGNMSIRHKDHFIITATQTSGLESMTNIDYAAVVSVSVPDNQVTYIGRKAPSSECMSHFGVYNANSAGAVIHVHDEALWSSFKDMLPTTPETSLYGTPEMAKSIEDLARGERGVIVLAGHRPGLISYGKDMVDAYRQIIDLCRRS